MDVWILVHIGIHISSIHNGTEDLNLAIKDSNAFF